MSKLANIFKFTNDLLYCKTNPIRFTLQFGNLIYDSWLQLNDSCPIISAMLRRGGGIVNLQNNIRQHLTLLSDMSDYVVCIDKVYWLAKAWLALLPPGLKFYFSSLKKFLWFPAVQFQFEFIFQYISFLMIITFEQLI